MKIQEWHRMIGREEEDACKQGQMFAGCNRQEGYNRWHLFKDVRMRRTEQGKGWTKEGATNEPRYEGNSKNKKQDGNWTTGTKLKCKKDTIGWEDDGACRSSF